MLPGEDHSAIGIGVVHAMQVTEAQSARSWSLAITRMTQIWAFAHHVGRCGSGAAGDAEKDHK